MSNFEKPTTEVLEINNILYEVMPSDVQVFSDNAISEEVYFRMNGAFSFRSKKSRMFLYIYIYRYIYIYL